MKSEHRHELKTNELGRLSERLMPFLEEYANRILIGFSVVALMAAVYIYVTRTASVTADASWTRFIAADTAEEFENIAEVYSGSTVGAWSRVNAAERHLNNGIRAAFKDREAALSDLKQARTILEGLLKEKNLPVQVRETGLYLLSRCLETTSDGNTDEAVEMYERLLKEFPDSMYKDQADRQIAVLKTKQAKDFYAWFHQQNPKPPDIEKPKDGASTETEIEGGEAEPQSGTPELKGEDEADEPEPKNDADTEKINETSTEQPDADGKQEPDLKPKEGEQPGKTDDSPSEK